MHRVTLPIGEADADLATQAAHWVERFYPGTCAAPSGRSVELTSELIDPITLERSWRAALHNERLYAENAGRRRALLESLTA